MSDTPEQDAGEAGSNYRRFLTERDAHAVTKRELKVLKSANAGTLRLQRVTIAALKRDKAKLRSEWASVEGDHTTYQLAVKQWESRTGLDMSDVLEGVHGSPLGKPSA